MPTFEPAQDLCARFYERVLAPVIGAPHSAGLLGPGSDVLGYDTERSTDHDWGPRATIFVDAERVAPVRAAVVSVLPETFDGWPVRIGRDGQEPRPQVEVTTLADWTRSQLGVDPLSAGLTHADWLALPQQRLLGIVSGAVFRDDLGELAELRALLASYPDDVWWWVLACQWQRLAQEEPFVQRTAEVGDHRGSSLVTARLVRDCMRLALLLARQYWPYSKWLGTAFARLEDPDGLGEHLSLALRSPDLSVREAHLVAAYQRLAERFNTLTADAWVDPSARTFHDRPAVILGADRFARASLSRVGSAELRRLPLVGAVDQLADSTDLLAQPDLCRQLRPLYAPPPRPDSA